jgi:hypothetical protein
MNPDPPVRTPTATELVAILSTRESTIIGKAVPVVAQLPRPAWWLRLLLLAAVTALGLMALLAVVSARVLGDVENLTRIQHQPAVPNLRPALPAPELLLQPSTFATALARQPDEAGHLHLARASLLLHAGRRAEAADAFAAAAATVTGLPPGQRLTWADLLVELGRIDEARAVLVDLDATRLDPAQRALTAALAGRCLLAQRPGDDG